MALPLKKLKTLLFPFFCKVELGELLFLFPEFTRMAMDRPSRVDAGRNHGVEHLMVDDELDEVEWHGRIVEQRVDPDLIAVPIKAAECHALECAEAPVRRPTDRDDVEVRKIPLADPIPEFMEIVYTPFCNERVRRYPLLGKIEMRHL